MFNSVAKYLWGGVDNEADYTDRPGQCQQEPGLHENTSPDDGDWVLVDTMDKENCCHQSTNSHHRNRQHHHHPSHLLAPHHHHNHHPCPSQSPPDPSGSTSHIACEIELLDDAASLAHHLDVHSDKSSRVAALEHRLPIVEGLDSVDSSDLEENGIDSGPRPSSPDSVFSACSGRSHATYRPKGHASEVWVVAPPPCFTGSQLGDSEPLASSPLENLLIEHPSMSVYYSVPSSSLPSSHPLFIPDIADPTTQAGRTAGEEEKAGEDTVSSGDVNSPASGDNLRLAPSPALRPRRHIPHHQAALHPIQLCPEKLVEKSRSAQRREALQKQKDVRPEKCHRWNLVQAYTTSTKKSNRRNRLMRPSGCKSSRNSQRMH